jgi:hypothetical protein
MLGSVVTYGGLVVALTAGLMAIEPRWMRRATRRRTTIAAVIGLGITTTGLLLPAPQSRIDGWVTHLDRQMPTWHFRELHRIEIAAPPQVAFEALERVRASDVLFFRTLTWLRRGGQPLPAGILNPGSDPLLEVALRGGFVSLAHDPPREIVLGTVVIAPTGTGHSIRNLLTGPLPPGFAVAAMNFLVTPVGPGRSMVSTETRVLASGATARRRFAGYWRLIYPGSALIRRMWLRAIERRATD